MLKGLAPDFAAVCAHVETSKVSGAWSKGKSMPPAVSTPSPAVCHPVTLLSSIATALGWCTSGA